MGTTDVSETDTTVTQVRMKLTSEERWRSFRSYLTK